MKTPDTDGPVLPLLVYDLNDIFCYPGLINSKGLNKSIENGVLWILDGLTGRLLPAHECDSRFPSSGRYLLNIEHDKIMVVAKLSITMTQIHNLTPEASAMAERDKTADIFARADVPGSKSFDDDPALFFYKLEDLLKQRKLKLPEGSYSTYLFKSGINKIRKKTGEEAVELILASEPKEVVSEASDFLYHLMVLLVALDIPIVNVFEELKKR